MFLSDYFRKKGKLHVWHILRFMIPLIVIVTALDVWLGVRAAVLAGWDSGSIEYKSGVITELSKWSGWHSDHYFIETEELKLTVTSAELPEGVDYATLENYRDAASELKFGYTKARNVPFLKYRDLASLMDGDKTVVESESIRARYKGQNAVFAAVMIPISLIVFIPTITMVITSVRVKKKRRAN